MKIFKPKINVEDIAEINKVLASGDLGFGSNVSVLENTFKHFSGYSQNVATNSASASAFMIFAYLKEKYGACDIYTTSLGFTSPAWAAKHHGHNLIWVDVDDNLLFDVEDYRKNRQVRCERYSDLGITPVIMPVLYGGVSTIPNIESLKDDNYNEIIVVDSAHCVTPTINADYIFFSFHPYKPIAASDGGMISTDNESAAEWFRSYRNFGRLNIEGTYDIIMEGFKFYMNNLNATIALTQTRKHNLRLEERKRTHGVIEYKNMPGRLLPHDENSSYYFSTLIAEEEYYNELARKYPVAKHYPMLHKTRYFNSNTKLKNLEKLHPFILNLPLYNEDIYYS